MAVFVLIVLYKIIHNSIQKCTKRVKIAGCKGGGGAIALLQSGGAAPGSGGRGS